MADAIGQKNNPRWLDALALLTALIAAVVAFLPFAQNTSPWDAVRLHVPENQGNWWHVLVGAPFFLAFPMIWLRVRFIASKPLTTFGKRLVWTLAALSAVGTILVETPFLRHLAGTSEWQRFVVLALGLGGMIASAAFLFARGARLSAPAACVAALDTAYLANAALCLIVYSSEPGPFSSRSGWLVTMVIVWPMLLELIWIYLRTFGTAARPQVATQYR